jgi:hypothetical protein
MTIHAERVASATAAFVMPIVSRAPRVSQTEGHRPNLREHPMSNTLTDDNRDMNVAEHAKQALAKFSPSFLARCAAKPLARAPQCRWELDRRAHEDRREQLLSPAHRNPVPAATIKPGDVISEGRGMRALVREAYTLTSGKVVLGVSWMSVVTGVPEEQTHQLPVLNGTDRSLHLVCHGLAEVSPYAVPIPEVTR